MSRANSILCDDFGVRPGEIEYLRKKIHQFSLDQDYESACFWCEKLYIMTNSDQDLYLYSQTLISSKKFTQNINLLNRRFQNMKKEFCVQPEVEIPKTPLWARYLLAKSYSYLGKCQNSLQYLQDIPLTKNADNVKTNVTFGGTSIASENSFSVPDIEFVDKNFIISQAAKLKATLLEYMSDETAPSCYLTSLSYDILQYGAARKLFENKMLLPKEEQAFFKHYMDAFESIGRNNVSTNSITLVKIALCFYMIFSTSCGSSSSSYVDSFLDSFYNAGNDEVLEKKPTLKDQINFTMSKEISSMVCPKEFEIVIKKVQNFFKTSIDLKNILSQVYLLFDETTKARILLQEILLDNGCDDFSANINYALCLFQMHDHIELKILAESMAAMANISINHQILYKVLCSIRDITVGNSPSAQESLRAAVKLSGIAAIRMTPFLISPTILWMILGHAAWNCGDKEHAIASFNSAADLSPGHFLIWFYIGGINAEAEAYSLALSYYLKAHKIALGQMGRVPFYVANEISCCLIRQKKFEMAVRVIFNSFPNIGQFTTKKATINLASSNYYYIFSKVFHNLSYAYLKLGMYDLALKYSELSNLLFPKSVKAMKLYGLVLNYCDRHEEAQIKYHEALLESCQFSGFDDTKKVVSYFSHSKLPPELVKNSYYKDQDLFLIDMIRRSIVLQGKK